MKRVPIPTFALIACCVFTVAASAFAPYENYTYPNGAEEAFPEPQSYLPQRVLAGPDLGVGELHHPEDIYVSPDRRVYVTDTGNNRIIVLDEAFRLIKVIDGFTADGAKSAFSEPKGVFCAQNKHLYIADSGNDRVVVLDENGAFVRVYTMPETPLLEGIRFNPQKLVVDFAYRVFVVSPNTNKGMIGIDKNGDFTGFYGAVQTPGGFLDIFKAIATRTQRETMEQNVPVVYSNADLDDEGFVYSSVSMTDVGGAWNPDIFVRRLNPSGKDVLPRRGFHDIVGDVSFYRNGDELEISNFCDVAFAGNGVYSVLGQRFGRVFTYDADGNLLHIFGAKGGGFGQFAQPVSLDTLGDKYLVLDRNYNQFVVFEPTEYGLLLQRASVAYANRRYGEAEELYDELLRRTVYSDTVYQGKGNCLYHKEEYTQAMKYYKLCGNRSMYIESFKFYRDDLINRYFGAVMTTGILLAAAAIAFAVIVRKKRRRADA